MAISIRQISEKCLGSRGAFSVVRNLLGYSNGRVPQATSTSLTIELRRFRDLEHVVLHIKTVSTAAWAFGDTDPVNQMIFSMRMVFGNANMAVIVRSTENLTLTDTDIDVGDCFRGGTSVDLDALFTNRNFVGPFEIVVYFVRSVLRGTTVAWDGCASSSHERPGATVARTASRWTLAHEVGHVIGLSHVEGDENCPAKKSPPELGGCMLTNVMTCCGTGRIPAGTTPTFDNFQKEVIKLSPLTQRCPS